MTDLKHKISNALDEGRMLILGVQIILGVLLRTVFQASFTELPAHARWLELGALLMIALSIVLLMWPSAYHRIVSRGQDTRDAHRFVTRILSVALLPFAFGMGMAAYVTTEGALGSFAATLVGGGATLAALVAWYAVTYAGRRARRKERVRALGAHVVRLRDEEQARADAHEEERDREKERESEERAKETAHGHEEERAETKEEEQELDNRIRHVLTEIRTVLPGAQALLGFQLSVVFMEEFKKLETSSVIVYITTLALLALGVVLLMLPAAYHRISEDGENSHRFHRFASRVMLVAMIFIGAALAASLFIVLRVVTHDVMTSATTALAFFALELYLWLGYTAMRRGKRRRQR